MTSGAGPYLVCLRGVLWREALRFVYQRERFIAALVRPLVWLFIFAVGFRSILGVSIVPPYETYITYETYIVPGLIGMIQLFNGMQSSLSMVYDREMGSMRVLLTSPLPRWFLLVSSIRQLENFAGIMNFVIFPMFFLSSALYPLWKVRESSDVLYWISALNPFTHAVESIRFTLYQEPAPLALAVVCGSFAVFFVLAVLGYDPKVGLIRRRAAE